MTVETQSGLKPNQTCGASPCIEIPPRAGPRAPAPRLSPPWAHRPGLGCGGGDGKDARQLASYGRIRIGEFCKHAGMRRAADQPTMAFTTRSPQNSAIATSVGGAAAI